MDCGAAEGCGRMHGVVEFCCVGLWKDKMCDWLSCLWTLMPSPPLLLLLR